MLSLKTISASLLATFLTSQGVQGFTTACIYDSYKCGVTLSGTAYGYNDTELITAVNATTVIPPLTIAQLSQTIFRCADTSGTIVANAFCINGCQDLEPHNGATSNDQCTI
ncbi:hypothetical protein BGW36DRAFT_430004 [Talaromyces proteolyticus]|uniref:Cyanovirin-N domain-containing protein n=1 Tax=Talaromyces proteolyticus TaxID=1131652 RepID=A0AAD4KLR4_9EURO|nr:uncharacterized protein BGW36DRAFT_430004 [Talaromyces proteolyticus]KAH8693981.1 hypothetical protein BGW36DRAFT_430004 [Talaromyces proteolyticus]